MPGLAFCDVMLDLIGPHCDIQGFFLPLLTLPTTENCRLQSENLHLPLNENCVGCFVFLDCSFFPHLFLKTKQQYGFTSRCKSFRSILFHFLSRLLLYCESFNCIQSGSETFITVCKSIEVSKYPFALAYH